MPGYANRGFGRGFGWGRRWGRGCGFGMWRWMRDWWGAPTMAQPDPAQERQMLQQEQSYLKTQMDQIQKRLDELGE